MRGPQTQINHSPHSSKPNATALGTWDTRPSPKQNMGLRSSSANSPLTGIVSILYVPICFISKPFLLFRNFKWHSSNLHAALKTFFFPGPTLTKSYAELFLVITVHHQVSTALKLNEQIHQKFPLGNFHAILA